MVKPTIVPKREKKTTVCDVLYSAAKTQLTNVKVLLLGELQLVVCNDYRALQGEAHGRIQPNSKECTYAHMHMGTYSNCDIWIPWESATKDHHIHILLPTGQGIV